MNENLPPVFKEIIALIRENKTKEINDLILKVVDVDSKNIDSIFKLGIECAKNNRLETAVLIFNCLLSKIKDDIKIPYNLGLIYALKGDYPHALEAFDCALKIKPDDVETLINKGVVCNDLKNYRYGLQSLESAIQIRSDIPEAWLNKGVSLNNLHLYTESISAYDEALKINPNFYQAWSNKSIPLNKLRRFLEAAEVCDKALSLKPDYAEAYFNKGDALRGLQRYEDALQCYDKALSLKPDYAEAYSYQGDALRGLQRYEDALQCYDKALSLKPENADYFYQKSLANIALNQYENAIENLKKAIEHNFKKVDHAEYILSALSPGYCLRPMPKDFVTELFDEYADYFDEHLIGNLQYRIPKNLMELLNLSVNSRLRVLDIGCGSGLMGNLLKPYASMIVGIDLSKEMLLKADLTGAYASLVAEDVGDFLNTTNQQFDLIVSADVFIYIGELNNIFKNAYRVLSDEGFFCFSVEKSDVKQLSLSPKTLRFSHSRQYIEELANFYNFKIQGFRDVPIRKENQVDVNGYAFLLQKS